jgi:valyl-tRNA synthetase
MPFITAEIWEILQKETQKQKAENENNGYEIIAGSLLSDVVLESVVSNSKRQFTGAVEKMKSIQEIITKIRTLRSEMNISPAVQIESVFNVLDAGREQNAKENENYIKQTAKLKDIKFEANASRPKNSALAVASGFEIFLPLEGLIDVEKEKARLLKEIALANDEVLRTSQKLSNENFIKRAPDAEIEKIKNRLNEANLKIKKINENLKFLN